MPLQRLPALVNILHLLDREVISRELSSQDNAKTTLIDQPLARCRYIGTSQSSYILKFSPIIPY